MVPLGIWIIGTFFVSLGNPETLNFNLANPMLEKIHNSKKRMPVILDEKDEIHWIDPSKNRPDLESFFKPFDENKLRAYPVNKHLFLRHENPLDPGILKEFHAKPEGDQFSLF